MIAEKKLPEDVVFVLQKHTNKKLMLRDRSIRKLFKKLYPITAESILVKIWNRTPWE